MVDLPIAKKFDDEWNNCDVSWFLLFSYLRNRQLFYKYFTLIIVIPITNSFPFVDLLNASKDIISAKSKNKLNKEQIKYNIQIYLECK